MIYKIDDVKITVAKDGKQCYFTVDGLYHSGFNITGGTTKKDIDDRSVYLLLQARQIIIKQRKIDPVLLTSRLEFDKYSPVKIKD